jgi:hypothetical protein
MRVIENKNMLIYQACVWLEKTTTTIKNNKKLSKIDGI